MANLPDIGIINKNKQLFCVEANVREDNVMVYHLALLKREKGQIHFDKTITNISSFEELKKEINKSIPIVLVLTGKGIIFRKVHLENQENKHSVINEVLPNAKVTDFYTQFFEEKAETRDNQVTNTIQNSNNDDSVLAKSWVCVTRKESADRVINSFLKEKFFIVDLFIGPGIGTLIHKYFSSAQNTVRTGNYLVQRNSDNECEITVSDNYEEEKIKIENEEISSLVLLPIAGGINYMVQNAGISSSDITLVKDSSEEYTSFKKFKSYGIAILSGFFCILLINFFIFDKYNTKYNQLSSSLTEYQGFLNDYTSLKNDLEEKQIILTETGLLNPSRMSFYTDRIAMDIPKGIKLNEIEINPISKKRKNNKTLEVTKGQINITGYSLKSTLFNGWLNTLRNYDWIEEISKFTYNTEDEKNNIPAGFSIEILIK